MHAYLLVGNKKSLQEKTIAKLCVKNTQKLIYNLQTINDVRKLQGLTKLSLKQKTIIIINDFEQSSEPAQNAFLKELEEPQSNLTYILLANRAEGILPTIHSRCKIIELGQNLPLKRDIQSFHNFYSSKPAEKLLIVNKIKTRDQAKSFLTKIISGGTAEIREDFNTTQILKKAVMALAAIEQNGNIQLQLTNFVISL